MHILAFFGLILAATHVQAETVIHAGPLLDSNIGTVLEERSIVVKGGVVYKGGN